MTDIAIRAFCHPGTAATTTLTAIRCELCALADAALRLGSASAWLCEGCAMAARRGRAALEIARVDRDSSNNLSRMYRLSHKSVAINSSFPWRIAWRNTIKGTRVYRRYRLADVARALGVSASTVGRWIIQGRLTAIRRPRLVLIRRSAIIRMLRNYPDIAKRVKIR